MTRWLLGLAVCACVLVAVAGAALLTVASPVSAAVVDCSSTTTTLGAGDSCAPYPLVEAAGGSMDVTLLFEGFVTFVLGMVVAGRVWGSER